MEAVPLHLREANEFVARHHRHNLPAVGCKFAVGGSHNGKLVGVAIAGRPVCRRLDDGKTLEILRVCTDGPIVVVYPEGTYYCRMTADRIPEFVQKHLIDGQPVEEWVFARNPLPPSA